jgi:hypothetical protein
MAKGIDTGKAYLAGVLSKITDPELKGLAERVFANATVQTEIGNGVEGQSEIDRQLQDLRTKQEELTTLQATLDDRDEKLTQWHEGLNGWKATNEEYLRLGKAAKDKGITDPAKIGAPDPSKALPAGVVTEEKLTEVLQREFASLGNFAIEQNDLMRRHLDTFGSLATFDVRALLTHPKIREVGLIGVYDLVHKDALTAKATEKAAAAEATIRKDERAKTLAEQAQMPYVSPSGVASGSPLDALKPSGTNALVDAATVEYTRLQTQRGAA